MIWKNTRADMKEIKAAVKRIEHNTIMLDQRLDNVDVKLADYNGQLKVHIKRTEVNERRISTMEKWALGLLTTLLITSIGIIIRAGLV